MMTFNSTRHHQCHQVLAHHHYELPPETGSEILQMTSRERVDAGVKHLPHNLAEAIAAMESSDLVREALGDHVFEWFLKNKKREWTRYQQHVSRYELEEYLPVL